MPHLPDRQANQRRSRPDHNGKDHRADGDEDHRLGSAPAGATGAATGLVGRAGRQHKRDPPDQPDNSPERSRTASHTP